MGGWSDGYVNGTYYNSYNYPGAGLTNDMTDEQFVTTLCDYVIAHVAEFYHGQPQYHEGWTNRYKQEKELCLSLLPEKPTVPPVEEEPLRRIPLRFRRSGTPLPRKAAEMRLRARRNRPRASCRPR